MNTAKIKEYKHDKKIISRYKIVIKIELKKQIHNYIYTVYRFIKKTFSYIEKKLKFRKSAVFRPIYKKTNKWNKNIIIIRDYTKIKHQFILILFNRSQNRQKKEEKKILQREVTHH